MEQEDPLEQEVATHSSILAWKILLTEEPGRLPSMWPRRVKTLLRNTQIYKQTFVTEMQSSFSGEGNGNPLQYFCLKNPMDGGAL